MYVAASKPATRIISSSSVLYIGKIQPQKDIGNLLGLCCRPRIYLSVHRLIIGKMIVFHDTQISERKHGRHQLVLQRHQD